MIPRRAELLKFSLADAQTAAGGWFNCGPGALCAVASMTPDDAVAHLRGFERKHYTNPTMMSEALRSIGISFIRRYEANTPWDGAGLGIYPDFGLVRVQWAGPWTQAGVPMRARYRHTHWVGWAAEEDLVFDINVLCVGGWIAGHEWRKQLVPWLIKEVEPKASGEWWPTHCWDIIR